ncbi:MAG: hypothetical protein RMY36_023325 [Nostoc sp. SerVER01]|nr:hypothetical protein [Nostoc sp. SerVER01]
MSIKATESEKLFEDLCVAHKINYERISTSSETGEQRPDYKITTQSGQSIYFEIKQFDPNPVERDVLKAGECTRRFDFPSDEIGERVRNAIRKASRQLKALSGGNHPSVIVIYNNVPYRVFHTDSYAVLVAMRGFDRISIITPDDPTESPVAGEMRTGGKKKFTAKDNTSVSAVAILFKTDTGDIGLNVYHNRFAKVPLQPEDLHGESIYHFRMVEDESDWINY